MHKVFINIIYIFVYTKNKFSLVYIQCTISWIPLRFMFFKITFIFLKVFENEEGEIPPRSLGPNKVYNELTSGAG